MRDKEIVTCCVTDPALDFDRMFREPQQIRKFGETRDRAVIQQFVKPGESPTWFHLRRIPSALWAGFVQAADTESEKVRRAFRASVTKIENLVQDDGTVMPTWEGTHRVNTRGGDVVIIGEDEADVVSHAEIEEIGTIAYQHSFLARRIERCFLLAPTSFDILQRMAAALDADESQRNAASSSSKPLEATG